MANIASQAHQTTSGEGNMMKELQTLECTLWIPRNPRDLS